MGEKVIYIGAIESQLDDRNRIRIPVKFQDYFGEKLKEVVICIGAGNCINMMDTDTFKKWTEEMQQISQGDPRIQLKKLFMATVSQPGIDTQGRFVLPSILKELTGITKDVVFVTEDDRVCIYDKAKYESTILNIDILNTNLSDIFGQLKL